MRSPDREGARILVSLPEVLPLVILRGSGETTAALAREAATHGVRTLAHAEGGGVLYIGAAADPAKAEALVEASLDRLGVCNRLNLLLVDRAAKVELGPVLERLGIAVREPERLGHEWANDSEHIASVTVRERRLARGSGRAREPRDLRPRGVDRHRGRGGGAALSQRATAAPRRSGTRRRGSPTASRSPARRRRGSTSIACRARAGRSRTAISTCGSTASSATERSTGEAPARRQARVEPRRRRARPSAARVAARTCGGDRRDRRERHAGLRRVVGCDRARPAAARAREASVEPAAAAGRVGARPGRAAARLAGRARAARARGRADSAHERRDRRAPRVRERAQRARRARSRSARCRS